MNRKKWEAAQAALLELTESACAVLERHAPFGLSDKQRADVLSDCHQIVMDTFELKNVYSDDNEINECEFEHLKDPVSAELKRRRTQTR